MMNSPGSDSFVDKPVMGMSFTKNNAPRIARELLLRLAIPERAADEQVDRLAQTRDMLLAAPRLNEADRESVRTSYTLDREAEIRRYRADARALLMEAARKGIKKWAPNAAGQAHVEELAELLAQTLRVVFEEAEQAQAFGFTERDGMLALDAVLFNVLAKVALAELQLIEDARNRAIQRWKAHRDLPPPASIYDDVLASSQDPANVWRLWAELKDGGVSFGVPNKEGRAKGVEAAIPRAVFNTLEALIPGAKARWDKRLEPVRAPTKALELFAGARIYGGRPNDGQVLVEAPSGVALTLPFDAVQVSQQRDGMVSLRQVLTPSALRDWLVTLLMYQDAGARDDGSFEFDGPSAILDLTGTPKLSERRGTRTIQRYDNKSMKLVKDHLALYPRIRVRAVGDLEAAAGDPLLDEIRDRRNGKTVTYAHSRLVVSHLRNEFLRLPRPVCRLDTNDVGTGMGIAFVVRRHVLNGRAFKLRRKIEAPIMEWLTAAGIPAHERARRDGRVFWSQASDELVSVAERGGLGTMTKHGAGQDTVLALAVDRSLLESYEPLVKAAQARASEKRTARIIDQRKADRP